MENSTLESNIVLKAASNFPVAYSMIASQTYVLQHIYYLYGKPHLTKTRVSFLSAPTVDKYVVKHKSAKLSCCVL